MKYMGSKRAMLKNGLGELLVEESANSNRVVDLFSGGGSVAWFAATQLNKPVLALDLQEYAKVLAASVIHRVSESNYTQLYEQWIDRAKIQRTRTKGWQEAIDLDGAGFNTATWKRRAEELCESNVISNRALLTPRYGGHYYSPSQALTLDALIRTLPTAGTNREVCLAALVISASRCAAAPGHTAQPFKANRTAGKYLREAWLRNPIEYAAQALKKLCPLHGSHIGQANVGDANEAARELLSGDLVFLDPPYSGVHYSRFYHVLETIARGYSGPVKGVGRYPPTEERPNSDYSKKTSSSSAMRELFETLSDRGCNVILTFPKEACSNGLSGDQLEEMANDFFVTRRKSVKSKFSTLGGNCTHREARQVSDELILSLKPR